MTLRNYWWLLGWIFIVGMFSLVYPTKHREIVLGRERECWRILPAVCVILPYLIWAGFRGDIADTYLYHKLFNEMPRSISAWSNYLYDINKDKGFSLLGLVIKFFVGNHVELYFLIIACIQLFCIVMIFRRYSSDYWLSIFLFIATTDYISWMFNGIRQFTAVAMIFATTGWILEKKYLRVLLVILLAATIHGSALLMIPVVFAIRGKPWNRRALLGIAACIIALLFVDQFTNILDTLLADTQYTNVVSDWKGWNDNGTNPIRVLVYSVPTILSVFCARWIREADDPVINLATNASLISTGLYLVSMGTSGIFIGRLPIYVSLYSTGILLPWIIDNVFTRESILMVKIATIVCFVGFFYFQMHFSWSFI